MQLAPSMRAVPGCEWGPRASPWAGDRVIYMGTTAAVTPAACCRERGCSQPQSTHQLRAAFSLPYFFLILKPISSARLPCWFALTVQRRFHKEVSCCCPTSRPRRASIPRTHTTPLSLPPLRSAQMLGMTSPNLQHVKPF